MTPPAVAEMLAVDEPVTVPPVTLKVPPAAPSGTVMAAGTVATAVLLDFTVTTVPPWPAGAFKVTVASAVPPLEMPAGARAIALTAGLAVTLSVADFVVVPVLIEIFGDAKAETAYVVTVNVVLVAPAGTVTVAGTEAAAVLLLVTENANPPCGAGPVRPTAAVDVAPPSTLAGARLNEDSAATLTVRVAVFVAP